LKDDRNSTRISDNQLGSSGFRAEDTCGNEGVGYRSIGADDQDTIGILNFFDGVGHCPAAKYCGQPGHGGGVSETGAVVNIVRPDGGPGELL
jgi:hypothetical protein